MTCSDYGQPIASAGEADPPWDQTLLLLAHGALPPWKALPVRLHLHRCPACRDRIAHLAQTSALLAAAVRGSELPAWSRRQAVSRANRRPGLRQAALAGLLLAALLVSTVLAVSRPHVVSRPQNAAAVIHHCP